MQVRLKKIEHGIIWSGIAVGAVAAWWVIQHYQITEVWIRGAGMWAPLVSIGLYALLSLTPIPSDPLTLLNGVLFGWNKGLLISWMGNNAAALVEYFVFRNVRDLTHFDQHREKLPVWLTRWPADSGWFLIVGRFIPGFGGKVVSILAGMYQVPWWKYMWTTAFANFLGALIYSLGGWGLLHSLRHLLEWMVRLKQII